MLHYVGVNIDLGGPEMGPISSNLGTFCPLIITLFYTVGQILNKGVVYLPHVLHTVMQLHINFFTQRLWCVLGGGVYCSIGEGCTANLL